MAEDDSEAQHLCNHPRVEIDAWGQRLHGCIQCNQWMNLDGEWLRLPEQDIAALRGLIGGGATHPKAASTQKKPRARDTGLRKETVVLPWGATTSTGKSLNRATVGLDGRKQPRLVRKAGAGAVTPSHPHGVTGCPSTVGEFCARRLIKWDFPLVTERGEFIGGDDHRNYDGSLKFRGCPFALGISLPLIEREREAILPVVHDFSDKRVLFASVPRCKVHSRPPKESPVVEGTQDRAESDGISGGWVLLRRQH